MHFVTGTTPNEQDSEWNLICKILLVLNSINSIGGGGGSTSGFLQAGNYAGGAPTWTPVGGVGIAFDTSNNAQWNYYNGGWH